MENTTPYSKSSRHRNSPRRTLQARHTNAWPFFDGKACLKAGGFTLVELLVVISIIALLVALSASALRLAREQAKFTVCQSNLRQLLVEFATYEATHGTLPFALDHKRSDLPPGGRAGNLGNDPTNDPLGWWWFHYLGLPTPHYYEPTILRCPSRSIADSALKYNGLYGNYGVNWSVFKSPQWSPKLTEFSGQPLCTSNLLYPSQTLLLVDSGYTLISWWHVADNPPFLLGHKKGLESSYLPGLGINPGRDLLPGQKNDALDGRHLNKSVNIGFADSHVDRKTAETLLVTKTEEGYTNLHPLWKPTPSSGP